MATVVKNGIAKMKSVTPKTDVKNKLAADAKKEKQAPVVPVSKPAIESKAPIINLEDRMQKFEQLQGLAKQRTRLSETLTDLNKFKYNQSDSARFEIKDSQGLSFVTTNSNLIHLVTNHLKHTLEDRKGEIEKQLLAFEL